MGMVFKADRWTFDVNELVLESVSNTIKEQYVATTKGRTRLDKLYGDIEIPTNGITIAQMGWLAANRGVLWCTIKKDVLSMGITEKPENDSSLNQPMI